MEVVFFCEYPTKKIQQQSQLIQYEGGRKKNTDLSDTVHNTVFISDIRYCIHFIRAIYCCMMLEWSDSWPESRWFWLCILFFRVWNALFVRTYFNPDEFWQSTEVAHHLVFGYGHL
jgi:hypothetical protein